MSGIPALLRVWPRSRAAPVGRPESGPAKTGIGWLADPPKGWMTSKTLPPVPKRMGQKVQVRHGVVSADTGSSSIDARQGRVLTIPVDGQLWSLMHTQMQAQYGPAYPRYAGGAVK